MIIEVARIKIKEGADDAFKAAIAQAEPVLKQAKGCLGLHLQHCIEAPDEYEVVIHWETLENHTVDFREGPLFPEWRALISPHFTEAPSVRHYTVAMERLTF